MIEKKIEEILEQKVQGLIDGDNIQILTTWGHKGIEESGKVGYISISVQPRRYSTPTIPTSEIPVTLTLTMRSEVDSEKTKYLEVTEKLMNAFQKWQDDIIQVSQDFTFTGFECSGFQISSGDAGLDASAKTWIWSIGVSFFGPISRIEEDNNNLTN